MSGKFSLVPLTEMYLLTGSTFLMLNGKLEISLFVTLKQVKEKVAYTCETLGVKGGYILSGSHHLQADIPVENVLAMYGAK